uniref:Glutathione peroxidase n=1 Tax=Chlamydomonas sp. (strain W80) TaxID=103365 RepID=Q9SXL6_CHLSW|nr:glutathione peroxidase [Chlamydomonas sp. W80]
MASPFYALAATDIAGKEFPFAQLQGKVVLVVNVASQCGFTPQYKGLQELYDKYKDEGLVIIGFPCDQFGHQEPGQESEIASFCQKNFGVTFPMMAKIEVNGDNTHPVYQFLKSEKKQLFMERIKWNFEKFLINKQGEVVERFSSAGDPMRNIAPAVAKLLAEA